VNLPPGVKNHHLPGNRPGDIETGEAMLELFEELQQVINHFQHEYPCLGDEAVLEVLGDLLPGRTISPQSVEVAIGRLIDQELTWTEECRVSQDPELFNVAQRTSQSRLLGAKMLARIILPKANEIEVLVENTREKIGGMDWQPPAA